MRRRGLFGGKLLWRGGPAILALALSLAPKAAAQNLCSTSDKTSVACTIANVYGPDGLSNGGALAAHGSHEGHFADSFLSNLRPLNTSIGSQLGILPLVSPSSGIVFSFDKTLGVSVPTEYNLGPILSERAGTIGRHKLLVGFSFQGFDFDTLDGLDLKKLPGIYTHEDYQPSSTSPVCSVNGNPPTADPIKNEGSCAFVRDTIATINNIDLRVNQYTAYFSFGLTDRLDISVAIPTVNVRMSVTSAASIHNNGSDSNHQFTDPATGQACLPSPCFNRTFLNSTGDTGIGDVTARAKYQLWKGERAGLAVGGDIRFPTGDSVNYLGSGAYGIKPFAAFSYNLTRIAFHANGGYQWNGSSFLAGNLAPSQNQGFVAATKDNLPSQLYYSVGAEYGVLKRLTAAVDFLGQEFINAPRIAASTYQELPACTLPALPTPQPACNSFAASGAVDPDFRSFKANYATADAAVGLRFKPFGKLLLTANVVTKLNDAGLRSKFVPLLGISYSH